MQKSAMQQCSLVSAFALHLRRAKAWHSDDGGRLKRDGCGGRAGIQKVAAAAIAAPGASERDACGSRVPEREADVVWQCVRQRKVDNMYRLRRWQLQLVWLNRYWVGDCVIDLYDACACRTVWQRRLRDARDGVPALPARCTRVCLMLNPSCCAPAPTRAAGHMSPACSSTAFAVTLKSRSAAAVQPPGGMLPQTRARCCLHRATAPAM